MIDPYALDDGDLIGWCARERVSYAGMFALRRAGQLSTSYRWDHARRGTVSSCPGRPDIFHPHDWLERGIEEREAAVPTLFDLDALEAPGMLPKRAGPEAPPGDALAKPKRARRAAGAGKGEAA